MSLVHRILRGMNLGPKHGDNIDSYSLFCGAHKSMASRGSDLDRDEKPCFALHVPQFPKVLLLLGNDFVDMGMSK